MKINRGRKSKPSSRKKSRYWSHQVTERSDALDLENRVFQSTSAKAIAASLKRSALASRRRKGTPFQSAMSMLTFYINRAGRSLPTGQKKVLERTKEALRQAFDRKANKNKRPELNSSRHRRTGARRSAKA